jgi:hypothetical protein
MYERLSNYTYIILLVSVLLNNTQLLVLFKPLILVCSCIGLIIIFLSLDRPKSILLDNLLVDLVSHVKIYDVSILIYITIIIKLLLITIVSRLKSNKNSYIATFVVLLIYVYFVDVLKVYNIKKLLKLN